MLISGKRFSAQRAKLVEAQMAWVPNFEPICVCIEILDAFDVIDDGLIAHIR